VQHPHCLTALAQNHRRHLPALDWSYHRRLKVSGWSYRRHRLRLGWSYYRHHHLKAFVRWLALLKTRIKLCLKQHTLNFYVFYS
jgi:hypothetical protein